MDSKGLIRSPNSVDYYVSVQANLGCMKLQIHQNISGYSLLEVFISAGIFLIFIQGTLSIIEKSSNQFKKSAFNFQTAAMLDYWNSEQVNLLLSQEIQSGNSNIPIKVFKEMTELHTQVEITNADQYKVSFQLIFQDHAKTVSWISEGIIDVPKN